MNGSIERRAVVPRVLGSADEAQNQEQNERSRRPEPLRHAWAGIRSQRTTIRTVAGFRCWIDHDLTIA